MSANIYEDVNMRYSRAGGVDGGHRVEQLVDIYQSADALPDRHQPEAGKHGAAGAQKHPAVFRAALLVLGLLSFLLLVAVFILSGLCFSIVRDKNQLSDRYKDLETRSENLSAGLCQSPGDDEYGNATGWKRFKCSCYYKSTSVRNWTESRADCQSRGADLVIINDMDEDKFVQKLSEDDASWIGLRVVESQTKWTSDWDWEWKWVDGSVLSYRGWHSGLRQEFPTGSKAYIDQLRKWNYAQTGSRRWICEKPLP